MDEMNITSDWTKMVITKIIKKAVKDKIGIDLDIDLGDVYLRIGDENVELVLSAQARAGKSQVFDLLKKNLF